MRGAVGGVRKLSLSPKLQGKGKKMAIVTSRTYPSLEMYAKCVAHQRA